MSSTFCSKGEDKLFIEGRLSPQKYSQNSNPFLYITNSENSITLCVFLSDNLENTFYLNILKTCPMIFCICSRTNIYILPILNDCVCIMTFYHDLYVWKRRLKLDLKSYVLELLRHFFCFWFWKTYSYDSISLKSKPRRVFLPSGRKGLSDMPGRETRTDERKMGVSF